MSFEPSSPESQTYDSDFPLTDLVDIDEVAYSPVIETSFDGEKEVRFILCLFILLTLLHFYSSAGVHLKLLIDVPFL